MATVDSYDTCPQCEKEDALTVSYQTRTGETHELCIHCGYMCWTTLVRSEDDYPKLTKDGKWQWRTYTREGAGAYELASLESSAHFLGRFLPGKAEQQLKRLRKQAKKGMFKIAFASVVEEDGSVHVIINDQDNMYANLVQVCPNCDASINHVQPTDTEGHAYECDNCQHFWSIDDDNLR